MEGAESIQRKPRKTLCCGSQNQESKGKSAFSGIRENFKLLLSSLRLGALASLAGEVAQENCHLLNSRFQGALDIYFPQEEKIPLPPAS